MKRKVLALILAFSCIAALTACTGNKEVSTDVEDTQEEAVSEPTQEPVEEEEPTPEPTQEPTPEPESEQEEKTEKPRAEAPSDLSDDLYDFQISIDGVVYQFPMWYSDFEAYGWEYLGDNTDTLSSNQYTVAERWKKDGFEIYTRFANLSMNTAAFADCEVAGIKMEQYNLEECNWEILLPGGIQYGVSNADDIRAAYGDPSSDYDGERYYMMTYKYDFYREISLYVYKDTDTLGTIEIQNMIELEGMDNSVSDEVPEQVKNYKAPAELGNDLYSFNLELEGNLYKLPCPVSVFLENGFQIDEHNSDTEVGAKSYGWVELRYNNQSLRVIADNYADYATVVENCFVTSIKSSDNGPKWDLVIPGNIKRGDSEADVEKAVKGFETEVETSDSGFTYYTVYDPKGSKLDNYCICLKDGAVLSIEVKSDNYTEE